MSTMAQVPTPYLPTESQLHVAYSVCRGITRSQAKNFYYGFLVLPKPKRQALNAVYAFMRRCDDIADDPSLSARDRRQKLDAWVDAFHAAEAGLPTDDPILLALVDAQRRFSIPVGLLDQLAFGTAMDVEEGQEQEASRHPIQYRSFQELERYCYNVASVVGLVCIHVFGYRDPAAERLAERLGLAFQLTNIIRDVKEDAALGRVYLPQEDLAQFGVSAAEVASIIEPVKLRPLLELEAQRAFENYAAGDELLHLVSEDSQPALWVLITIYRGLLQKIVRLNYDVFTRRVSLTLREKLTIFGKGFLKRIL
ncbi:MAG TPA: phytoene/squalene synthase family protein [Terriglobales bacterium]|nr:phytoene/squalene synthase family protein [Terriglobales bacterium]